MLFINIDMLQCYGLILFGNAKQGHNVAVALPDTRRSVQPRTYTLSDLSLTCRALIWSGKLAYLLKPETFCICSCTVTALPAHSLYCMIFVLNARKASTFAK